MPPPITKTSDSFELANCSETSLCVGEAIIGAGLGWVNEIVQTTYRRPGPSAERETTGATNQDVSSNGIVVMNVVC